MNEEECFVLSPSWFHLTPWKDRRADTSASFDFKCCSIVFAKQLCKGPEC